MALALLAFGSPARASGELDIPPECGNRAAFDRALRERLGEAAPIRSVAVVITRAQARSRLRVQIGDDVRELEDASCSELLRAAVVVAVAMLSHEPAAASPPPPAPPARSPAARERRASPRWTLGAGAGVGLGTLPHPVLALELEGQALWQHLGVSVNVRYLTPSEKTVGDAKGVRLQALGAGVSGIFRPAPAWEARLGFAAQRLSGRGTGEIAEPGRDSAWAAGPTLGLAFVPWRSASFWAGVGAEGQLNALRSRFEILHYYRPVSDDPFIAYQVPWIAGAAFVRWGLIW